MLIILICLSCIYHRAHGFLDYNSTRMVNLTASYSIPLVMFNRVWISWLCYRVLCKDIFFDSVSYISCEIHLSIHVLQYCRLKGINTLCNLLLHTSVLLNILLCVFGMILYGAFRLHHYLPCLLKYLSQKKMLLDDSFGLFLIAWSNTQFNWAVIIIQSTQNEMVSKMLKIDIEIHLKHLLWLVSASPLTFSNDSCRDPYSVNSRSLPHV